MAVWWGRPVVPGSSASSRWMLLIEPMGRPVASAKAWSEAIHNTARTQRCSERRCGSASYREPQTAGYEAATREAYEASASRRLKIRCPRATHSSSNRTPHNLRRCGLFFRYLSHHFFLSSVGGQITIQRSSVQTEQCSSSCHGLLSQTSSSDTILEYCSEQDANVLAVVESQDLAATAAAAKHSSMKYLSN